MRTDLPETGSVSGLVRQCFGRNTGDYEQRGIFSDCTCSPSSSAPPMGETQGTMRRNLTETVPLRVPVQHRSREIRRELWVSLCLPSSSPSGEIQGIVVRNLRETVPVCRLLLHAPPMRETQEVEGRYVPDCSPSPSSPASHTSGRGKSEQGLVETVPVRCPLRQGLRERREEVREGARLRLFLFAVHFGMIYERGARKSEKGLV